MSPAPLQERGKVHITAFSEKVARDRPRTRYFPRPIYLDPIGGRYAVNFFHGILLVTTGLLKVSLRPINEAFTLNPYPARRTAIKQVPGVLLTSQSERKNLVRVLPGIPFLSGFHFYFFIFIFRGRGISRSSPHRHQRPS